MMIAKSPKPLTTVLSTPVEPSDDEKGAQLAAEWAERKLDILLAYTKTVPSFGKLLCTKVVDTFGSDDTLGPLMRGRLRIERIGKQKGARRKWNKSRYLLMLMHYEIRRTLFNREESREETLKWIGESEGIGINGKDGFNHKKVEARITEARKTIPEAELHLYLPDFMSPPR